MIQTVFFSWQADTDTRCGRNLVLRALELAVARLAEDGEVSEAIRDLKVDSDTQGISGTPPIVETIFRKIDTAAVYVADLTFVATRKDGRPCPNPNVLVEYGWALKSLGYERIVLVMNIAYGVPSSETLPFNLAHLRHPIKYSCPLEADEEIRRKVRLDLAKDLELAIKPILASQAKDALNVESPKPYRERRANGGVGRFRPMSDPLGVVEDAFRRSSRSIRLGAGHPVWMRVMPKADPGRVWRVSDMKKHLSSSGNFVLPFGGRGRDFDSVRAEDGVGNVVVSSQSNEETSAVSFAFTSGEIWGVDVRVLSDTSGPPAVIPNLFRQYSDALEIYSRVLKGMGIAFPVQWEAGIEGTKGRQIYVPLANRTNPFEGHCVSDLVVERGVYQEGDDPLRALKPFFEKLYDSCGIRIDDLGVDVFKSDPSTKQSKK